ncbi:MAG: polynucleotide adenylyltransferase PcnB [Treponema sp.]
MLVRYNRNASDKQITKALVYTDSEHGISIKKIDAEALRIIRGLHTNGYEAYIVGGAVRDLLIGKTPKDFDIVTSAEPSRIRKIFKNSRIIGKRFRLVHVFYGQKIYEVATFRSLEEGTVGNCFGTIEDDVRRRDFTLNGLYYDPLKNIIVDYVGGVEDIRKQQLRAIIPLPVIFAEDPVRMIRALKYGVSTHASLPFLLRCRIHRDAPLLEYISPSRLTEEINKIMLGGCAHAVIESMLHFNIFLYLQPAAYAFMEDSPGFAEKYMAGLQELDQLVESHKIQRQGHFIIYLIRDFLNLITDWSGSPREVYQNVYTECRHFILPMNPQRVEFEYAVRQCLRNGGLDIRSIRSAKKEADKRRSRSAPHAPESGKIRTKRSTARKADLVTPRTV